MPIRRLVRRAPASLRTRLLFLVLASVFPFMLLIGLVARRHLLDQKPLAGERALARAQRVADRLDDRLSNIVVVMRALPFSVSASPGDAPANDRMLRELAVRVGPGLAYWRVFSMDGDLIGSSTPAGGALQRAYMRSLWQNRPAREPFVSEPVTTPSGDRVVNMISQIRDLRGDSAVVVAQIRLASLQSLLSAADLPEGSSVGVISEGGVLLARIPNPERWVGYSISGTPLDSVARSLGSRTTEFTTQDSVRRMIAVARTRQAPWLVGAGVPMSAVVAQARLDFARALGYGGLALALALALAMWQASRIIDPLTRLSADAAKLGTGNLAHRSGVMRSDELGVLAATINEMATTLEQQGAVLRESEARYRGLFDINPLPMWVLDPESMAFLAVNAAAVEAYGYSEEEFLGMKVTDIRPAEDVPALLTRMVEMDDRSRRYVTRHQRKDGTLFPVEIDSGAIVFDGRPARLVVAQDVTERFRAEAALRDAEVQLRQSQRLEAIGQLTGGIAHDFNNVLTAIGSYSDFLYESLDPGDARRLDILEIRKAADRAASLTKQLLAFSRSQILQPRVLNVNDALSELEALLKRLLTAEIELVFSLDQDAGNVRVDPGQLAQVVMNLAVNARDAMPDGGVLTVSSCNEHVSGSDGIAAATHPIKPGDYVVIEVADTGVGMNSDTQQRIFEPFFTTKGPGKGTGLGLSTAYGIVHQSGGYISCDSEPGKGTKFTIRLPRVDQSVESDKPKAERAVAGRRSEIILVVEDEESVRRAAKRILVKKGYTVVEAVDGNDALDMMDTHARIDLLLTDLVMPGMGGRELVRVLHEQGRSVPTLYMSGYTKDAVMRAELDPDIAVLEKPFSQDELASKVREVLDKNGHQ